MNTVYVSAFRIQKFWHGSVCCPGIPIGADNVTGTIQAGADAFREQVTDSVS